MKYRQRYIKQVMGLLCSLCILSILALVCGDEQYSLVTILDALLGHGTKGIVFIIQEVRLPKVVTAIFCGFAFGVAGNTFQKMLKNPLASPDVMGISTGISVSLVVCTLIFNLNKVSSFVVAFIFGLLLVLIIYGLATWRGYSDSKLILMGLAMQAFLLAILSSILLMVSEYRVMSAFRWISGSLNQAQRESLPMLILSVILLSCCMMSLSAKLDVLQLGDDVATTLGVVVNKIRLQLVICSLLLMVVAINATGPLAAIALLSGPIATRLTRNVYTNVFLTGLIGSHLVLLSYLATQTILPYQYPVGIVSGFIGAIYLIKLLLRQRREMSGC